MAAPPDSARAGPSGSSRPGAAGLTWRLTDRTLDCSGPPLCAGIVNVTSDSFWEGARSGTPERATHDAGRLVAQGFDLIDAGAVAARSGPPVQPEDEAALLIPAVIGMVASLDVPVLADTFSAPVARRAVAAGACGINDISGVRDPDLFELCAETGAGLVVMHIEGPPRVDREAPHYDDVVERLGEFFSERLETAARHGVAAEQIVLDPGLDFDLSVDDDVEICVRLAELQSLGRPLMLAISRKDFLGALLAGSWEDRLPAGEREWATAALAALTTADGAQILRLHDPSGRDAALVAHAIVTA